MSCCNPIESKTGLLRNFTRNPWLVWTSREIVGWTPFLFILILLFQLDLNSFILMVIINKFVIVNNSVLVKIIILKF